MCHRLWQGDCTCKQVVNRLKIPQVSPHYCFTGGVKFPQGEESVVIDCLKNYLLYKDATCHNLWCYCFLFSVLFSIALNCFFLYIFYLLWLFLWLFKKKLPSSFPWLCCSFSRASFSPECCFSWLFLWLLLPNSSWWLFFSTP